MGMTIMLDQDVVEEALVAYITGEGINTSNKDISVTIIGGRQGNGCKAEVTLTTKPLESAVEPLKAVPAENTSEKEVAEVPVEETIEDTSAVEGSLFQSAP